MYRFTHTAFFLLFLVAIAMVALSGCRSDSDPQRPEPVDPTLLDSISFSGDEGVSLSAEGVNITLPGGMVTGNWVLKLRKVPVSDHSELIPASVAGSIFRIQIVAGDSGTKTSTPENEKNVQPMLVTVPMPEEYAYQDVAPVYSASTGILGQYGTAFLASTHNTVSHAVEAVLQFNTAGAELLQSHLEDGVDFYLTVVDGQCAAESNPQLVPLNDEPLGDRDVLLIVHGFSMGSLCHGQDYVAAFEDLETELSGTESINQNFKIVSYHYPVNRNLLDSGSDLKQMLDATYPSGTNFTIIAYSLGGLVVRSAMENHGLDAEVARLFTVGTPHGGTAWAGAGNTLSQDLDLSLSLLPHQAASRFDVAEGSDFLTTLNASSADRSEYRTIGSTVLESQCEAYLWLGLPNQWLICHASNNPGGDGVVLLGSSLLEGSIKKAFYGTQFGHLALMTQVDVRAYIIEDIVQDFQGLNVGSNPSGAFITLDGISLGMMTPAVIHNIIPGTHELSLSLPGYNDYTETVPYDGAVSWVFSVMQTPQWPRPLVTIVNPLPEANFNTNIIRVSGYIELENEYGEMIEFTGNEAILKVGSADMAIEVIDGYFSVETSILAGPNNLRVRASSQDGDTGYSPEIVVNGAFDSNDIQLVLTWDTPGADLDLHVINPLGEHCYFGDMVISDGSLDVDDQSGYGPESFTSAQALDGTYQVYVNCYALHGDLQVNAGLVVHLNGNPAQLWGPHRFIMDDEGAGNSDALWDVLEFTMEAGKILKVEKPASGKSKTRAALVTKKK